MFKNNESYKELISRGLVDITHKLNSKNKTYIALMPSKYIERFNKKVMKPKDMFYIITKGGYVRKNVWTEEDYYHSSGWNSNGKIISRFNKNNPEQGLLDLLINIKMHNNEISHQEIYDIKAPIKMQNIIIWLFDHDSNNYNYRGFIDGYNNVEPRTENRFISPWKMIRGNKQSQGIVKMAKELGV